uniref:Uncharacterized protein n=1 Tax=Arundo donax TaxID=35708 RepID=A0A0A8YTT2_ARUDO
MAEQEATTGAISGMHVHLRPCHVSHECLQ